MEDIGKRKKSPNVRSPEAIGHAENRAKVLFDRGKASTTMPFDLVFQKASAYAPTRTHTESKMGPNYSSFRAFMAKDAANTSMVGHRKAAGVLPEFLDAPRRGVSLDPRSDDFSRNQAFGRGVGAAALGSTLGGVAGAAVGGPKGAAIGALGGGAITGVATHRKKLREFRELQRQGRNPATGKKHGPAKGSSR